MIESENRRTLLTGAPLFHLPLHPQTLCDLANEWQNTVMMPDGVALHGVQDGCVALGTTLVNLTHIIILTWPPGRQPSLGTEGGQSPTHEQRLHLEHMSETEHKWYLKQHEFTTSLQRYACSRLLSTQILDSMNELQKPFTSHASCAARC
jgi:hypothetical protein